MKKIAVLITFLFAILLFQGCGMLFDSAMETEEGYTVTVPVLHLSMNGEEEQLYTVSGVANRNDTYYMVQATIANTEGGDTTFTIAFRDEVTVGSYDYSEPIGITYKEPYYDESQGYYNRMSWIKNSADTFVVDITRWDSKVSFSFDAVIYKYSYESDSSGNSSYSYTEPMAVSGYVEDIPFYNYTDTSNNQYTATINLNGLEQEWYVNSGNDNGSGLVNYSSNYNLYLKEPAFDDYNMYSLSIQLAPDITTGTFSSSNDISIYVSRSTSPNESYSWSSGSDGSTSTLTITELGENASFSFSGTLNYNSNDSSSILTDTPDPITISGSVSSLPVVTGTDNSNNGNSPVDVTIDGSSETYYYSSISNYGTYYQLYLNPSTFGSSSNNIGIEFSPNISTGSYANTSDYNIWYYDQTSGSSWNSNDTNSDTLLTVTSWDGATASFSFSGTFYNGNDSTTKSMSATLTDVPIYTSSSTNSSSGTTASFTVDSVSYSTWNTYFWTDGSSSYGSNNIRYSDGTTVRDLSIQIPVGTSTGTYDQTSSISIYYNETVSSVQSYFNYESNSSTTWSMTISSIDSSSISFTLSGTFYDSSSNTRDVSISATLPVNSN